MTNDNHDIHLGLGLIGIGREWGFSKSQIPDEKSVLNFLEYAYVLGITFFDTAASYGLSEERFGKFLHLLTPEERSRITVATKFGDHWNAGSQTAFIDHSYGALRKSLDTSMKHLGKIDVLQLHRPNPAALKSDEVHRAFEYARILDICVLGASVSDIESGNIACEDDLFSVIQLPYNSAKTKLESIIDRAKDKNKLLLINRPYNMGEAMQSATPFPDEVRTEAFRLIIGKKFRGIVLTGTKSEKHLKENWESFQRALS